MNVFEVVTNPTGQGAPSSYNLTGQYGTNGFYTVESTGLRLFASVNGKHLLETTPNVYTYGNSVNVSTTGDFYLSGGLSVMTGRKSDFFQYSIRDAQNPLFYDAETNTGMIFGFSGQIANANLYDYYLNGIKLHSGASYNVTSNKFFWTDSDTNVTGRLHAMVKKVGATTTSGEFFDLWGSTTFIRGESLMQINGLDVSNGNYLEIYSGMADKIRTGVNSATGSTTGVYSFSTI